MNDALQILRNWSEVWALLIPLTFAIYYRKAKIKELHPIHIYLILAFILNLFSTIIFVFHSSLPTNFKNNNILYNLHSVTRVLLLGWYILSLKMPNFQLLKKIGLSVYLIFIVINFSFFESPFIFSSRIFSIETIVLLFLCIAYYFNSMRDESPTDWLKHPSFLVCTGISIYEAINFFIFLFFYPLFLKNPEFGKLTMTIANMMYVILCLLLALAIRRAARQAPAS